MGNELHAHSYLMTAGPVEMFFQNMLHGGVQVHAGQAAACVAKERRMVLALLVLPTRVFDILCQALAVGACLQAGKPARI
jgi:hypothetical protein